MIKDVVFRQEYKGVFHYYGSYGNGDYIFTPNDEMGIAVFENENFYDKYNPYEWEWKTKRWGFFDRGYKLENKRYHHMSFKDSIKVDIFLRNHPEFKRLKGVKGFYGGTYVGPFNHGRMGGDIVFFCKNGDVIVGFFADWGITRGEYLVRHGDYCNYFFKGTFNDMLPMKGQWYDSEGRKTLLPQKEILGQ